MIYDIELESKLHEKTSEGKFLSGCFCCEVPIGPVSTKETTKCKHKRGQCDKCSTSPFNDQIHVTHNGTGCVAKLMKKGYK